MYGTFYDGSLCLSHRTDTGCRAAGNDLCGAWAAGCCLCGLQSDFYGKKAMSGRRPCSCSKETIQELYEKLVFGQVSRDEYVTAKTCFLSRKREICEQIWQLQDEERKNGIQDNAGCGQTFEEEQEIRQAAKDMLAELLREVVIYPGCRVQIIWQVRDPFAAGGADLPQAGDACRQTKTACTSDTDGSGF